MTIQRTDLGRELEEALGEVLAHVRGTTPLPCRILRQFRVGKGRVSQVRVSGKDYTTILLTTISLCILFREGSRQ